MRTALLLSAAVGLVAAAPQKIDFAAVNAAPTPSVQGPAITAKVQRPTYNPTVAASEAVASASADPVASKRKLRARNACSVQPAGSGPLTSSPDTADAFLANPVYNQGAGNAPTPQGYSLAFGSLTGSTSQNGYMGLYTLTKYDTIKCQQLCDAAFGCTAFNIYYERDPSLDPGSTCPDPASTTNIKCTLWGFPICGDTATNKGQWLQNFHVVIAGSNGYVKSAPPKSQPDFTGPTALGGAVQAPLDNGVDTYIGMRLYPDGAYDPSLCAAVCKQTTAYDAATADATGKYKPCNFFNSYVLSKNNVPQGTYCAFYTRPWDRGYGTNVGQYDGAGNYYSVSQSYSYTLTTQDPGVVVRT
ncbi:hypothetical protein LTR50_000847 [Elasticomyces elasticus]|nr:hypothetical protein LTR50_000847 [Elasticomyces elasticus]